MDPEEYRKNIRIQLTATIKQMLNSGQMTVQRAKEIAQFAIQTIPEGLTVEQIREGVVKITNQFKELSRLTITSDNAFEEKAKDTVLPEISKLIQSGNIDKADELLKQILHTDTKSANP